MNPTDNRTSDMFDIDMTQRAMAQTGSAALHTEEVPIGKAVGRVLAEPLGSPRSAPAHGNRPAPAAGNTLDTGLRLESRHVPRLASSGRATVRVFQKLRVGLLTLRDSEAPAPGPTPGRQDLAGPMLASLLEGLGTVAIAAPLVPSDAEDVRPILCMLLKECKLVLIAGCMTPARDAQLREALASRGARLEDWRLCDELGASMMVAAWDDKVVACLPCGLAQAFMAFMLLISPLIRRLQGRTDLLPPSRAVNVRRRRVPRRTGGQFVWAHETGVCSELAVQSNDALSAIDAIARSDGIARGVIVSDLGEIMDAQYYPFSTWLQ